MMILVRAISFMLLFITTSCGFYKSKENFVCSQGLFEYSYGDSAFQCLSQIDNNSNIAVLLTTLKENTIVETIGILENDDAKNDSERYAIVLEMICEIETTEFKGERYIQNVVVPVQPLQVDVISFPGIVCHQYKNVSLLMFEEDIKKVLDYQSLFKPPFKR